MTIRADKTRRSVLQTGLAIVGGAAAIGVKAQEALAQEKIAQAQVQYQNMPKDGNECDKCAQFEAPSSCKIVAGTINPKGWCVAFAPKES